MIVLLVQQKSSLIETWATTQDMYESTHIKNNAQNFGCSYHDKNALLEELNELFPEHDVAELRQVLSMQPNCNLYNAIDDLMTYELQLERNKSESAIRTRVGVDRGAIEPRQKFRSEAYQTAVFKRLRLEFAQYDSPSTIRAVLSEHNFDYELTRIALSAVFKKKTFWSLIKNFFSSKVKEGAEDQLGEIVSTGCDELDAEIQAIAAKKRRVEREAQIQTDLTLAQFINQEEHTEANEMMECGCCFCEYTWDEMASCDGGHLVCRACVSAAAQECAFGQAGNSYSPCGLRCIAVSNEKCDHLISTMTLEDILSVELMGKLAARVMARELEMANLDLIRCPFCLYAEFKESPPRVRLRPLFRYLVLGFLGFLTFFYPFILGNITVPLMICIQYTNLLEWKRWSGSINAAYGRRNNILLDGSRTFKCRNIVECGRESCLQCSKEWAPFHDCLKDEKDGLRLYVEKAMADAVKRTVYVIAFES